MARQNTVFTLLEWLARLILAAVLLYAALPKLLDPVAFAKAIDNYRVVFPLIGKGYVYPVAAFLPALELVTAIALLWNYTKRAAALMSAILLVVFIILISQAVMRGLNIDCGCFGAGKTSKLVAREVGLKAILEDVVWFAMAVFVYIRTGRQAGKRIGKYSI